MLCSVVLVGRLHGEQGCCEEVINRSSFRQQGQSARQNDCMWAGMPIAEASGTHAYTHVILDLCHSNQSKHVKYQRTV